MIIVLEGPDLAGKSTIASHLKSFYHDRQHRPVEVIKISQPVESEGIDLFVEYVQQIYGAYTKTVMEPDLVVIFDRLHIGEWVYGPRKRANSKLSWAQIVAIDDMLDSIGAHKVFVSQPIPELMKRFDARGEDFVTKAELTDIAKHYMAILDPYSSPAMEVHREPTLNRWRVVAKTNDLGAFL